MPNTLALLSCATLCLAGSPAAKTRNHNHAHASRRRERCLETAHPAANVPRAAREATAPTAQQTMVSLGDLAPPEKPTGRRYLTGRPDGQEAVWRNPRRYLVPKPSEGRAAARQEGDQEPEGRRRDLVVARAPVPGPRGAVGLRLAERDFVGTHLNRKIIPVPLEETLEHRLGFKGRVRDRRNGIPKIGLKEVVDMWPGYMKQEGLIGPVRRRQPHAGQRRPQAP